ncbi:MAG: ABC transporter permease [Chloroflexota bacterium]
MTLLQLFVESLESLSANRVRSALTMLGIIIGVAAVIAMMSIGNGAEDAITQQISSIGTNLLYVMPGGDATNPRPLTMKDAQALLSPQFATNIAAVAPVLQGQVEVSIAGESTNTSIVAVTPDFFKVQTADVTEGTQITQAALDDYAAVALIGSETATDLFNGTSGLVGQTIRIQGQIFRIIGVLKEQGGTGFNNPDDRVIVPLTTAQLRLLKRDAPGEIDLMYVQAASSETVTKAQEQVTQLLRARHRVNEDDDFQIMNTQSLLEAASQVTAILTAFLGGIAGVSLLVGGIGIMNIMLVTVSERTREIGLRKAIGARKADIRLQFMVESSLLSLGGGLIGILTGWGIARVIGQIAAAAGTSLNPSVTIDSVLLATLFSAAVGLFFGIYPANRAANLQPVEALRSE